jgi:hypothetical protein
VKARVLIDSCNTGADANRIPVNVARARALVKFAQNRLGGGGGGWVGGIVVRARRVGG